MPPLSLEPPELPDVLVPVGLTPPVPPVGEVDLSTDVVGALVVALVLSSSLPQPLQATAEAAIASAAMRLDVRLISTSFR